MAIGLFANVIRGASPRPIDNPVWFDSHSKIGWLRISDVTDSGKFLFDTTQNLSAAGIANSRPVKCGSLVMSICATVGRPIITRKDVCIHDGFVVFDNLRADKEYLYYVLLNMEPSWSKHGQTGSQMNLNIGLISSTVVPLPPLVEQRAIAEALSGVDGLIAALQTLITKKRAVKQATMQQLVTGRTRLPGFGGAWGMMRLGDFTTIRNQKVLPTNVPSDTPCVELDHIGQGNGRLLGCSTAHLSASSKYRFRVGDLLFGRLRPYLRKFWLADRAGLCTTEIWPLVTDPRHAVGGFLHALVQSDRLVEAACISYGTHMPRADWNVMRNLNVYLPKVREQRAIVSILSDMDIEIYALERRRDKTQVFKQAIVQQLLSGRTRLVHPGISSV